MTPASLRISRALTRAGLYLTLAGVAAACNLVHMRRGAIVEDLQTWGMRSSSVEIGPDRIHFWEGGEGPAVVLLHGFGAGGMWQWHEQVAELHRNYRVVVPDLLWFGDSTSDQLDYSLEHQARAVRGLMEYLGIPRAHLVGISYGGYVANAVAQSCGACVDRMVLVDSPCGVLTPEDQRDLLARLGASSIEEVLLPEGPEDIARLLNIAYYDPPWTPDFVRAEVLEELYSAHRIHRAGLLAAARAVVGRPGGAGGGDSTLVIWGREDRYFPLELGRRLAVARGAELAVIPRARHAPQLEHPEQFNQVLTGFLGRAPGQEPAWKTSSGSRNLVARRRPRPSP